MSVALSTFQCQATLTVKRLFHAREYIGPNNAQDSPSPWQKSNNSSKTQLTPIDESRLLTNKEKKLIQEMVGTFLSLAGSTALFTTTRACFFIVFDWLLVGRQIVSPSGASPERPFECVPSGKARTQTLRFGRKTQQK